MPDLSSMRLRKRDTITREGLSREAFPLLLSGVGGWVKEKTGGVHCVHPPMSRREGARSSGQ